MAVFIKNMLWFKNSVVPLSTYSDDPSVFSCFGKYTLPHFFSSQTCLNCTYACVRARVSRTELQIPRERHVAIFKRQIACSFKWHRGMNSKAFYCLLRSEGAQSNDQGEGTKMWLKTDARQMQAPCLVKKVTKRRTESSKSLSLEPFGLYILCS